MDAVATPAAVRWQVQVVFGIGDARLAKRLADEVGRFTSLDALACPATMEKLRDTVTRTSPGAIMLDDMFLGGAPLLDSLCRLTESAPVILLAPAARQAQAAGLVAEGDLEFVVRVGDFVPLAVSLLERRVRWAERAKSACGQPRAELPGNIAEIFRHEINNPLTGILGNAELLLAHRDRMHATDTQRLETVVSLAVRLRETVRRLSNSPWNGVHPLKSA